ncbi:MAG: hypothetical protein HY964_10320 [Ignavibacteriales bacterium]|nr:hypothetical protein [Ignavibacteriales bacterium]
MYIRRYLLFCFFVAFCLTTGQGQWNFYDPRDLSTGTVTLYGEECPDTGLGGDPYLNALKNRDKPVSNFQTFSISKIINDLPDDLPASNRKNWSEGDQKAVAKYEKKAVQVTGYILDVKKMSPEACNCQNDSARDFHIWLAAKRGAAKDASIVIEVSPRMLATHPTWTRERIKKLATDTTKVRISGYLMWDHEHKTTNLRGRATPWEIHPIHKIEMKQGRVWKEL